MLLDGLARNRWAIVIIVLVGCTKESPSRSASPPVPTAVVGAAASPSSATQGRWRTLVAHCPMRNLSAVPGGTFLHFAEIDQFDPGWTVRIRPDGTLDEATRGRGDMVVGDFPADAWLSTRAELRKWSGTGWAGPTRKQASFPEDWVSWKGQRLAVSHKKGSPPVLVSTSKPPPNLSLPGAAESRSIQAVTVVDGLFVASGAVDDMARYVFVEGAPELINTGIYSHVFPTHDPDAKQCSSRSMRTAIPLRSRSRRTDRA